MSDQAPTTPNPSGAVVSTLQMAQDVRLCRLFALVGLAIDDGIPDLDVESALSDCLLDLAPEYAPPFEDEHRPDWERLVEDATGMVSAGVSSPTGERDDGPGPSDPVPSVMPDGLPDGGTACMGIAAATRRTDD